MIEQEENSDQKARGLIVRFHRWPSLKEQKELNRILKSRGLKRSKSIRSFKAQLFAWREGGLKASRFGEQACLKLKSLSYVRRCAPDHLLSPNTAKFLLASAGLEKSSQTEVGFNFECENCKDLGQKIVWETSRKVLNLKTCDIVSRKRKLKKDTLSDYWAQELIGSDLLREELEKTSAPNIENYIGVFDSTTINHNIHVKNLISDEGLHAVLPELGKEKTPFLNTQLKPSGNNPFDHSEYKEGKGYKPALSLYETSYPGDYLFSLKGRAPRYINNSMAWVESEDIYEVFKELSSSKISKSIIVASSGNDFPKRLDDILSKASQDFDVIVVGSFSSEWLCEWFFSIWRRSFYFSAF